MNSEIYRYELDDTDNSKNTIYVTKDAKVLSVEVTRKEGETDLEDISIWVLITNIYDTRVPRNFMVFKTGEPFDSLYSDENNSKFIGTVLKNIDNTKTKYAFHVFEIIE